MTSLDITPSWNSILEDMRNDPEMSSEEMVQLEHAFKTLAKHLGDDFPASSVRRQHPLDFPLVHNKAAFPKKWLIWLGNAIDLLAEHKNFPAVRRKIHSSKRFRESMNFIRFSYRLASSGWSLEFEPNLKHRKCPDLLCISPKDNEVIVEITALGGCKLEQREKQGLTRMVAGLAGLATDFVTCGRLISIPKKADFDRISKVSENFQDQLRLNASFLTVEVPGLLEISGSPKSDRAQVESWAAKRGLAPGNYICSTTDGKDDLLRR
ncbi:hypothetical protein KA005_41060, partial [bacterium]|nr:hypothetical protein [bacterium]